MRGDAVSYLFIFFCATFYYYAPSLLSAVNALFVSAVECWTVVGRTVVGSSAALGSREAAGVPQ